MDMNRLGAALDNQRDYGMPMQSAFREAALAITNLYRTSQSSAARAYDVGYSQCLKDVLQVLQSNLDGNSVQHLFHWVEARQETLKRAQEGESDDETPIQPSKPQRTQPSQSQPQSHSPPQPPSPPHLPASLPTTDFSFECAPSSSSSPATTTRQRAKRAPRSRDVPSDPAHPIIGIKRKTLEPELLTVLPDQHNDPATAGTSTAMELVDGLLPARPSKRTARRPLLE